MNICPGERPGTMLARYNVALLVDYSGSTSLPNDCTKPSAQSRHDAMREGAIGVVAEVLPFDDDGVDIYLFNDGNVKKRLNVTSVEDASAFLASQRPYGSTPIFAALSLAFQTASENDSGKPNIFIVLFDGQPDHGTEGLIEQLIVNLADQQDDENSDLIVFVQYGDDAHGAEWLKKLDKGLTSAKKDIVFSVSHTEYGNYPNILAMIAAGMIDNRV